MKRQVLAYGSGRHRPEFLKYLAEITEKKRPKICFLPTASGDDKDYIIDFYQKCRTLDVLPDHLPVWVNSYEHKTPFAARIKGADAIVVGGGNTLNMMAIWQAQGIDAALREAYDQGCVMAGGSAGSLCWFQGGTTDSRPARLSIVEGLGLIAASHCPHYNSEASRRPLYHENITKGNLLPGYACDDASGIHFINGKVHTAIGLGTDDASYQVGLENGAIQEQRIPQIQL